jgi:hypothetical protein
MSGVIARLNPWLGAVIVRLSVIRSGSPIAFFDARFPPLELMLLGCTLRRTKAGRLWCAPPKQRRQLPDGTIEWTDLVAWDGGGPASRFSEACIEAIERHSPELLRPMIEGQGAPALLALPRQQRDPTELATPPDWWDR